MFWKYQGLKKLVWMSCAGGGGGVHVLAHGPIQIPLNVDVDDASRAHCVFSNYPTSLIFLIEDSGMTSDRKPKRLRLSLA